MKPTDIVAALRAKDPKILGDIADKKAEQIVKSALTVIRESIVAAEKGDHPVAMLGRFKVNEITKGEGAEAIVVRKVIFIPAKPAENKDGSADSKGAPPAEDKAEPADQAAAPAAPSAAAAAFAPIASSAATGGKAAKPGKAKA
ncbi:hypothetical protein [Ideonella sp.]|uniref:hypothetical protein n=1 Tax=Ideonella sp. TaxID=1929293 RepID=UPI002B47E8D4|nr:hypothetical protein [Ideonella sp.]